MSPGGRSVQKSRASGRRLRTVCGVSPPPTLPPGLQPQEPESEHARSFRTHASYLRAMRELAVGPQAVPLEQALVRLVARAKAQPVRGTVGQSVDGDAVRGCLNRAWGTELILATTSELAADSDVIRLANGWASVQAYYAMYGAAQALIVAEGGARPENHEKTRQAFVNLWPARRVDLAPWTFAVVAPGSAGADTAGFVGGPGRPLDTGMHAWKWWDGPQCWDMAAKALHSTRRHHVDDQFRSARDRKHAERRKAWTATQKEREAAGKTRLAQPAWWDSSPQLTPQEKAAVQARARPQTLMDYLYGLRIRANYEDAAMFTEGPDSDHAAAAWSRNLVALTSATLLVHELRLVDLLGRDAVLQAANDWLRRNKTSVTGGLATRRDLLAS